MQENQIQERKEKNIFLYPKFGISPYETKTIACHDGRAGGRQNII